MRKKGVLLSVICICVLLLASVSSAVVAKRTGMVNNIFEQTSSLLLKINLNRSGNV
jgi:hypothetical protein